MKSIYYEICILTTNLNTNTNNSIEMNGTMIYTMHDIDNNSNKYTTTNCPPYSLLGIITRTLVPTYIDFLSGVDNLVSMIPLSMEGSDRIARIVQGLYVWLLLWTSHDLM